MAESGSNSVKSALRVVDILELLAGAVEPLRLSDVATALEMPKSSAHALLQTLVSKDFVTRSVENRYHISVRLFSVASAGLGTLDVARIARPVMNELSASLQATVNLGVLDGHEVVYIDKVQDRSTFVQLSTYVGGRLTAHATALGKVLVSRLSHEQRLRWLSEHEFTPLTDRSIRGAGAFEKELKVTLERGYAIDAEESHAGVSCVAANVSDHSSPSVCALSVTLLTTAFESHGAEVVGTEVRAAAHKISAKMGGR